MSPLFALEVRETIEAIERAFGAEVQARAFERGQLSDGDVTRDFLEHALRVTPNMLETVAAVVSNKGDFAEVMDISVRNRRLNHPGSDFTFVREHMRLLERLRSIERQVYEERRRPELRPEISEAIVRASVDVLWLRDRYGIQFQDLDYSTIDGTPLNGLPIPRNVDDLFAVDAELRETLLYRALSEGLGEESRLSRYLLSRIYAGARSRLERIFD